MSQQFAINKTLATLVFKNGYLNILPGGFAAVTSFDLNTAEFADAKYRNWIEVSDTVPDAGDLPSIKPVEIESPNKGMTADELKKELAKGKETEYKATVEAFGATSNEASEPVVEAIGRETTVEVTPEPEVPAETPVEASPEPVAEPEAEVAAEAPVAATKPSKGRKATA